MGIKNYILFSMAIATCILSATMDLEATIYGSISGGVLAEDTGRGLEGVKIRLVDADLDSRVALIHTINPNDEGEFSFIGVPPGLYRVTAEDFSLETDSRQEWKALQEALTIHFEPRQ